VCQGRCRRAKRGVDHEITGGEMRIVWPWQDRSGKVSWLKMVTLGLLLFPGVRFAYQVAAGEFGTLPVGLSGMVYWSGVWATVILLFALAITPVAKIFRWSAVIDVRRMAGVTALVYTLAHALIFFAFRSWDISVIIKETVARWSPIVATLSTVGLIVLAATSFDAAVRYMGVKRWQWLHNTIYLTAGLAIGHVLLVRGVYSEQFVFAGIFLWLMIWRPLNRYKLGADLRALVILSVGSSLVTALLEATWYWSRRGFDVPGTLRNNFSVEALDIGIPPAWQVLAFGLVFVFGAICSEALRNAAVARAQQSKA
jgi:sulfoxide reductase heme-binding subunit YedZ